MMKALSATIVGILFMCCIPTTFGQTVVVVDAPVGAHSTIFFNCHCNEDECYQEYIQPGAGCSATRHGAESVRKDLESRHGDLNIRNSSLLVAQACAMKLCQDSGMSHCRVIKPIHRGDYLAIASGSDANTMVQQTRTVSDLNTESTMEGEGGSASNSRSKTIGGEVVVTAEGKLLGVGGSASAAVRGSHQRADAESRTTQTSKTSIDGSQSQTSQNRSTSTRLVWRSGPSKFRAETEAVQACLDQGLDECRVQVIATSERVSCPTPDPLQVAIESDESRSFSVFLDAGHSVHVAALHRAVQRGDIV